MANTTLAIPKSEVTTEKHFNEQRKFHNDFGETESRRVIIETTRIDEICRFRVIMTGHW